MSDDELDLEFDELPFTRARVPAQRDELSSALLAGDALTVATAWLDAKSATRNLIPRDVLHEGFTTLARASSTEEMSGPLAATALALADSLSELGGVAWEVMSVADAVVDIDEQRRQWLAVWARADVRVASVRALVAGSIDEELRTSGYCDDPHRGLMTNAELVEELRARLAVGSMHEHYTTMGTDEDDFGTFDGDTWLADKLVELVVSATKPASKGITIHASSGPITVPSGPTTPVYTGPSIGSGVTSVSFTGAVGSLPASSPWRPMTDDEYDEAVATVAGAFDVPIGLVTPHSSLRSSDAREPDWVTEYEPEPERLREPTPARIVLPRGYRELGGIGNIPWIERDGTHLELELHADGRVTWRMVHSASGALVEPDWESGAL